MPRLPIAVIGAGLIGRTHVDRALREPGVKLVAIADPAPAGRQLAEDAGVRGFADFADMIDAVKPEAVVIASPNATHARIAIHCLERGVAVLVEKPVADTVADAQRICCSGGGRRRAGHRRPSAAAQPDRAPCARDHRAERQDRAPRMPDRDGDVVQAGRLLRYALAPRAGRRPHPDQPDPRHRPAALPVRRRRDRAGDRIERRSRFRGRGHRRGVLLRFRNGALGTVTVSDTAVAPWNWDLAAGEAERFPRQDVNSHYLRRAPTRR